MSTESGVKRKRFLAPQEKYEIWMQLVGGETTVGEAADRARVDRSTVAKLREVARQGALDALARSRPGRRDKQRDVEAEAAGGRDRASAHCVGRDGGEVDAGGGKRALGLSGGVPRRVDAATKSALMDLVVRAEAAGWSTRAACVRLELSQRRLERWRVRVADGEGLDDAGPGGGAVHGLTPGEQHEIVGAFVFFWDSGCWARRG